MTQAYRTVLRFENGFQRD